MTDPEVVLSYENDRWCARGEGCDLAHPDLACLDALIARAFGERSPACRVHVRFDLTALPTWLRQYQAHYCNYVLRIAPQHAPA